MQSKPMRVGAVLCRPTWRKDWSGNVVMTTAFLAVDQGTTATKAHVLADDGSFRECARFIHRQIYPRQGWVEHDPEELLANVAGCLAAAPLTVSAAGLANQGETVVAWDARDGRPLGNAIVWQDARTTETVEALRAEGAEELTLARAGLPLDGYFSASKLRWMLDNLPGARDLARAGHLRLGTSDAFFLDRLCGEFATDVSTAARTSLMNLRDLAWDPVLCELFGVPTECLPEIRPTTGPFGTARGEGFALPMTASLVDQTAALFGHRCWTEGGTKITFGTGAFVLAVQGVTPPDRVAKGLSSVVAWQLGEAPAVYALDGGVHCAAAAVNWAQREGFFEEFDQIAAFDGPSAISRRIVCVPSFAGLGAPHWDSAAAGMFHGLGLDTTRSDMCRALLEGIVLRVNEVVEAIVLATGGKGVLSIDGGLVQSGYLRQFLADATGREVVVPSVGEATALGTAWMAMIGAGAVRASGPMPGPSEFKFRHFPESPVTADERARFAEAVARAANWN
jgi:glycerol kinase